MSMLDKAGKFLSSLSPKEQADQPASIEHDSFTGSRFIVIGLAVLGLLWAPKFGLGADLIQLCFWLVVVYIVCNTITRTAQILVNGKLAQDFQKLAYQDGKLDEVEAKSLSDRHAAVK